TCVTRSENRNGKVRWCKLHIDSGNFNDVMCLLAKPSHHALKFPLSMCNLHQRTFPFLFSDRVTQVSPCSFLIHRHTLQAFSLFLEQHLHPLHVRYDLLAREILMIVRKDESFSPNERRCSTGYKA